MVEPPSLEVPKEGLEVTFSALGWGQGGDGHSWDSMTMERFSNLSDSVILFCHWINHATGVFRRSSVLYNVCSISVFPSGSENLLWPEIQQGKGRAVTAELKPKQRAASTE